MTLELTWAEASQLKEALDLHLQEQEIEVAHTENPRFRRELVASFALLPGLRDRLASLLDEGLAVPGLQPA